MKVNIDSVVRKLLRKQMQEIFYLPEINVWWECRFKSNFTYLYLNLNG